MHSALKSDGVGRGVKDKLLKHLEDKSNEISTQGGLADTSNVVNYRGVRYVTNAAACNKGPGRIYHFLTLLSYEISNLVS